MAFVKFVEKNTFTCAFRYAPGAYMNIYNTVFMTTYPVFQIVQFYKFREACTNDLYLHMRKL